MRSTIPATLVALGCLAIHAFGCSAGSENNTSASSASGGAGSTGQGGASGGAGGGGSGGGPECIPSVEKCDGKDNNCDGQVDEDCPCIEGQTQSCYSGPDGTEGVGPCAAGQQTCDATGKWGNCVGQVVPKSQETCNGQDDNCNGVADDMGMLSCGIGGCQQTVVQCQNGQLNTCTPGQPELEDCDGIDNDCDQLVDETFPGKGQVCDSGLPGICAGGKKACVNGVRVCSPDVMPGVETCNGIDDDCDGMIDENIPGTGGLCGTGLPGVCGNGAIQCNGFNIGCYPITGQSPEKCNGLDDDCDESVDEGDPEGGTACNSGQLGVCGVGTNHCKNGQIVCTPNTTGQPEQCNGLDDDCNGTIDDGNPGGGGACGCGGTLQCTGGQIVCGGQPKIFLEEDFTDAPGWTLGTEWEIKAAPMTTTCNDPTTDTSASTDNKLAGVVVGGCSTSATSKTLHTHFYLTTPAFNAAGASGVILQFRRWLNTDAKPYMNSVVEVFNGTAWVQVWESAATISDTSWQKVSYDVSAHANANMRVRWGFNVGNTGVLPVGSWNIDDVMISASACP